MSPSPTSLSGYRFPNTSFMLTARLRLVMTGLLYPTHAHSSLACFDFFFEHKEWPPAASFFLEFKKDVCIICTGWLKCSENLSSATLPPCGCPSNQFKFVKSLYHSVCKHSQTNYRSGQICLLNIKYAFFLQCSNENTLGGLAELQCSGH